MRLSTFLLLATALAVATPAIAQEGGGYGGGGMGGGGMGGRGGGHHRGNRGQGQTQSQGQPGAQTPVRAPTEVPVAMRLTGVVIVSGQARALAHTAIAAAKPDVSALYAERSAQVTLDSVDLNGAGDVSLIADGRGSGLGSALLVGSQAAVTAKGGHITSTGQGGNAVFVGDAGSKLDLKNVAISTHAADAFGVEATAGGSVVADTVTIATGADRATAVAVETPDSQAILAGGRLSTQGAAANAFFVAGTLEAHGVTAETADADGLLAEAARSVVLTDTTLNSARYGAMLYAGNLPAREGGPGAERPAPRGPAISGPVAPAARVPAAEPLTEEAPLRRTTFSMSGGELRGRHAALYVTNLHADITLDHVAVHSDSGILVRSAADQWGPLGRNGGEVHMVTHHQTLTGDFATDVISSIGLSLNDGSVLTGATTPNVDVDMDASSQWVLTGDTNVGKLADAAIVGDSVPNITGNGHTLTYDHRHNPQLGNKTYALAGGGQLVPGGL